jgi:hypothetical protein
MKITNTHLNTPENVDEKQVNQCDGCQRGLPKDTRGLHMDGSTFGLGCTANRYTKSSGNAK